MRDMLLVRTDIKAVSSVLLDSDTPDRGGRRAALGTSTLVQRFRAPVSHKFWFWAPYIAEALADVFCDALLERCSGRLLSLLILISGSSATCRRRWCPVCVQPL